MDAINRLYIHVGEIVINDLYDLWVYHVHTDATHGTQPVARELREKQQNYVFSGI